MTKTTQELPVDGTVWKLDGQERYRIYNNKFQIYSHGRWENATGTDGWLSELRNSDLGYEEVPPPSQRME